MTHKELNCYTVKYWYLHKSILHPLNNIALKYAIIPATFVPYKRIFLKSSHILSAWHNRLLPENLNILVLLNKNM